MSDFGMDVIDTRERWNAYHQVENTYLATFQALGSLGLLLGTIGLGAVLARNVLERRREIGLVRAIGFTPADVRAMVLAEGMMLVISGLAIGAGCAVIAITPVLMDRAQALPWASLIGLIVGVMLTGALASLAALRKYVEGSALAAGLRSSKWIYPLVNAGHIAGIALLFGGIAGFDLRLMGAWRRVPLDALAQVLVPVAAAGLVLAALCGSLLFIVKATEYAASSLFQAKMAMLVLGLLNIAAYRLRKE